MDANAGYIGIRIVDAKSLEAIAEFKGNCDVIFDRVASLSRQEYMYLTGIHEGVDDFVDTKFNNVQSLFLIKELEKLSNQIDEIEFNKHVSQIIQFLKQVNPETFAEFHS